MKKILMLSLILLSFGLVFTSCSDDDNSDTGTEKKMLLSSIKYNDGVETKIDYDTNCRITKVSLIGNDGSRVKTLTYNSEGLLVRMVDTSSRSSESEYFDFTFIGDTIIRTMKYGESSWPNIDTLIVNERNQLVKHYLGSYIDTFEYDAKGNLVKKVSISSSNSGNINADHYTYDGRKGAFSHINIAPWVIAVDLLDLSLYALVENPVKNEESYIVTVNGVETTETSLEEFTYTYDENGYPLTMQVVDDENDSSTFTYKEID